MNKKFILLVLLILVTFSGCGAASYNDEPNSIQRAKILSKNNKSITVEHSTWGKPIAFRFADEHCASLGKAAVLMSSQQQYGPDVFTTWRCE